MKAEVFDDRICQLGEGPLWHPERQQFFWFDILGKRLLTHTEDGPAEWAFDEHISAAGWTDTNRLLIASETALWEFDINTEEQSFVHALDSENPATRSNDGRADPWGGFWIGTMGKASEPGAGAIYRYFDGELRKLVPNITVTNTICFGPGQNLAYFADSPTRKIMCVDLDPASGWPCSEPRLHLDLSAYSSAPDGAVTDAQGNLWLACWGAGLVACYAPDGSLLSRIEVDAKQSSCPAFGGSNLRDLYITSAAVGLQGDEYRHNGCTFVARDVGSGVAEPRVML